MNKSKIEEVIKKSIDAGEKILLWDYCDADLLKRFLAIVKESEGNSIEVWHSNEELSSNNTSRFFLKEDLNVAVNLYRLYEFSDKVALVSDSSNFGLLFNVLKAGLISEDELFKAFLN